VLLRSDLPYSVTSRSLPSVAADTHQTFSFVPAACSSLLSTLAVPSHKHPVQWQSDQTPSRQKKQRHCQHHWLPRYVDPTKIWTVLPPDGDPVDRSMLRWTADVCRLRQIDRVWTRCLQVVGKQTEGELRAGHERVTENLHYQSVTINTHPV